MEFRKHRSFIAIASAMAFSASVTNLYADMVTEWNANLESAIFATAQPVPAQPRFSAIVQVAVYDHRSFPLTPQKHRSSSRL
jgi:hypothetical protein